MKHDIGQTHFSIDIEETSGIAAQTAEPSLLAENESSPDSTMAVETTGETEDPGLATSDKVIAPA